MTKHEFEVAVRTLIYLNEIDPDEAASIFHRSIGGDWEHEYNEIYKVCSNDNEFYKIPDDFDQGWSNYYAILFPSWFIAGSCCGGTGISIWNHKAGQFECAECKAPKSTDPSYIGGGIAYPWPEQPSASIPKRKQCECGSEKLGSDKHSVWCPKYG